MGNIAESFHGRALPQPFQATIKMMTNVPERLAQPFADLS
jgi:hypothetical protein